MGRRAQVIESTILKALESAGQAPVAKAIGVDESTITNLKYPDRQKINFQSISMILEKLGLKVVDETWVCVDPEEYEHMQYFAERYFADRKARRKQKLEFPEDDPE